MIVDLVSDTHREIGGYLSKLEEISRPDRIFFLGDRVEDGEDLAEALGLEVNIVKGNNDYLNQTYPLESLIELEGHSFLLSHGHLYDVNFDINNLYYRARELGVDFVFFGHTHRPLLLEYDGLTIINPGSPSCPRSREMIKTFVRLELGKTVKYKLIEID